MDPKIIKDWRDKLSALLDRANAIALNPDLLARRAVAKDLQAFIMDNPPSVSTEPETAEFDEMDAIARKAHDALLLSVVEDRVAAIASRSAELAGLTRKVAAQTAANEKAARSLRLEKAIRVASTATETVNAIKELKAQIEDHPSTEQDFTELTKHLGIALQSLQDLRTAVESTS